MSATHCLMYFNPFEFSGQDPTHVPSFIFSMISDGSKESRDGSC